MLSLMEFLKKDNVNVDDIKKIKQLTQEDIFGLAKVYQEIITLEEQYKQTTLGRKQIAEEIRKKANIAQRFLFYFKSNLRHINEKYEYTQDYLNDYEKAIRVILKLVNKEEQKYSQVLLHIEDEVTFETTHGDREKIPVDGKVLIIAKKDVVDKLDNELVYRAYEVGLITNKIVSQQTSLIVLTDYHYDTLVKPNIFGHTPALGEEKINAYNISGDISCYFYDEDLLEAVNAFKNFIQKNGADIKDLDENKIVQNIISNNELIRTKKKNSN